MGTFATLIWVALWALCKTIFQFTGILIVGILVVLVLLSQYEGLVEERRDTGEEHKADETYETYETYEADEADEADEVDQVDDVDEYNEYNYKDD